jgi:beta-glucosidase
MVVAYIRGLQSKGVGACVKHFIANDQEFERRTISSEVGERALREIYLPPFEAACKEADAVAIMSAYNKVNGIHCDMHPLLNDVLRKEWKWQGIVVSDWLGTNSTVESAMAGLDIEMPAPVSFYGKKLKEAVLDGNVPMQAIDESASRIMRAALRVGATPERSGAVEGALDRKEHRAVLLEAASEGVVMLKNKSNTLPLKPSDLKNVALIGPAVTDLQIQGGGSAGVNPYFLVQPLDSIQALLGGASGQVAVTHEPGCMIYKQIPAMLPVFGTTLTTPSGSQSGILLEYFDNTDYKGEPVYTQVVGTGRLVWYGQMPAHLNPANCSVRAKTVLVPAQSGEGRFNLQTTGIGRMYLDGQLLIARPKIKGEDGMNGIVNLQKGRAYAVQFECALTRAGMLNALICGFLPPGGKEGPDQEALINRAVAAAKQADAVVVMVGTNDDWECEGDDRTTLLLPGRQNELIERVAAANPNVVVVCNTGSPVEMPWAQQVPAVLQNYFSGQETANALANIIFGKVSPSGKLPTTWPVRYQDSPTYAVGYPGENGKVQYGDGIYVGYRYFDVKNLQPLWCFGHGLTYTTFEYTDFEVKVSSNAPITCSMKITNTGSATAADIVQIYVRDVECTVLRPQKELKAFQKVLLSPGEVRTLSFPLTVRDLSFFDEKLGDWVAENGHFMVMAGSSCQDIRCSKMFNFSGGLNRSWKKRHGLAMDVSRD